jgi:hypothetical protein
MKISKMTKIGGVLFILTLATTTLFAQRGFRNRYYLPDYNVMSCINQISRLTEDQKTEIRELEIQHQKEMDALRAERRSTIDLDEKGLIREEMLEVREEHLNQVKKVLNEEQKAQFEQIQSAGTLHKYQNYWGRGLYGYGIANDSVPALRRDYRNVAPQMYGRGMPRRGNRGWNGRGYGSYGGFRRNF